MKFIQMKNIPMLTSSIFKKMKRIKNQMQIYLCPHFFLLAAGSYIEVDALLGLCLVVLQFLWSSGLDLCSLPRSTAEACRIVAGQDCGGTGKVICRVEARIGCNQVDNLVTTDDGTWWQLLTREGMLVARSSGNMRIWGELSRECICPNGNWWQGLTTVELGSQRIIQRQDQMQCRV